jgi:hypothetical protein
MNRPPKVHPPRRGDLVYRTRPIPPWLVCEDHRACVAIVWLIIMSCMRFLRALRGSARNHSRIWKSSVCGQGLGITRRRGEQMASGRKEGGVRRLVRGRTRTPPVTPSKAAASCTHSSGKRRPGPRLRDGWRRQMDDVVKAEPGFRMAFNRARQVAGQSKASRHRLIRCQYFYFPIRP